MTSDSKVLPVEVRVLEPTALDIATTPLTVDVKVLPDRPKVLVVAPVKSAVRSKGADTIPLTLEVKLEPESESPLELITGVVPETTPLTVEVSRLPVVDTALELMID